jgi:hypothetical protein
MVAAGDLCAEKSFIGKRSWKYMKDDFTSQMKILVSTIKKDMSNGSANNKSDW